MSRETISVVMAKPLIDTFFYAKSYAIIGASTKPGSAGYVLAERFTQGFQGKTFLINPRGGEIFGHKLYADLSEIEEEIEAAIVVIPAKFGVPTVKACLEKGIKHIVVISGGFAESSEEGRIWQEEITKMADEA
ncbi:MAG: CoA-binding protein, partial [Candidatus Heimdallarchaeota archaeon]|nr:CoA-binding protein [Candidatus Heimdallarchaeota archaeon]MCK5049525.1 CoA-binding protein [Candidatus Heimdallarchaeota archaeon]